MRNIPKLAIIVPCYNEEQVLGETIKRLSETLENLIDKKRLKAIVLFYTSMMVVRTVLGI